MSWPTEAVCLWIFNDAECAAAVKEIAASDCYDTVAQCEDAIQKWVEEYVGEQQNQLADTLVQHALGHTDWRVVLSLATLAVAELRSA